jgi:hypothetical protein
VHGLLRHESNDEKQQSMEMIMEPMNMNEEKLAFNLVRDILGEKICPERISQSDARTYMAIVLDNNRHRTICRLYLGNKQKYIGTISERKVETRTEIGSVNDIAHFSRVLADTVKRYEDKI